MEIVRDERRATPKPAIDSPGPRRRRVAMFAAVAFISCAAWLSLGGAAFALSRRVNAPGRA